MVANVVADLKALEEELDEECARELAGAFLEDAANEMAAVDQCIASQNAGELKAHAHALKGCCRTIKAEDAEAVCTDLESAAIGADWGKITSLRPLLQKHYDELCAFIHGYLGN